jgi:hypothetical protein
LGETAARRQRDRGDLFYDSKLGEATIEIWVRDFSREDCFAEQLAATSNNAGAARA